MSETSVKIIKNEIRCRDDTVPKSVDTRSHCKVWLRACNNLPQPPPYISVFWGCGRLLHALNHTLQWLLVSTVFGTVVSLHDFYTCKIYKYWKEIPCYTCTCTIAPISCIGYVCTYHVNCTVCTLYMYIQSAVFLWADGDQPHNHAINL